MKKFLLFILLFCSAKASAEEGFLKSAFFTYENDSVYRVDRFYSNGIQFSFLTKDFYDGIKLFKNQDRYNFSFGLGQKIYTSRDISIKWPLLDDRPYAGYLYFFLNANIFHENIIDSFGVSLGATGKISLAEQTQKIVHDIIGTTKPEGWGNQIPNEFLFMLTWMRTWQFNDPQANAYDWLLMPKIYATVGTPFTSLAPSIEFRYGWNLQKDDLTFNKIQGTLQNSYDGDELSYYGFLELIADINLYNTFLDKSGKGIVNDIERENFFYEAILGFGLTINKFYTKISTNYISKEFDKQIHDQLIFTLTVGYNF